MPPEKCTDPKRAAQLKTKNTRGNILPDQETELGLAKF